MTAKIKELEAEIATLKNQLQKAFRDKQEEVAKAEKMKTQFEGKIFDLEQ